MDKLERLLKELPKTHLIHLMYSALDIMQGYNGRSIEACILESLGAKGTENNDGSWTWEMPSLKEAKENTKGHFVG